jgi:hypothetical protein
VYAFLDMHYNFWTTLISTENRIPSMPAAVISNMSTLVLAAILAHFTGLDLGAFVIAPLLCGLVFNYWFWPRVGAEGLETSWSRFMFRAPRSAVATSARQDALAV